jgi:hypothetical protein
MTQATNDISSFFSSDSTFFEHSSQIFLVENAAHAHT